MAVLFAWALRGSVANVMCHHPRLADVSYMFRSHLCVHKQPANWSHSDFEPTSVTPCVQSPLLVSGWLEKMLSPPQVSCFHIAIMSVLIQRANTAPIECKPGRNRLCATESQRLSHVIRFAQSTHVTLPRPSSYH